MPCKQRNYNDNLRRIKRTVSEMEPLEILEPQSPDLAAMPFSYTDTRMKLTRYFATQERYQKFLKKQAK